MIATESANNRESKSPASAGGLAHAPASRTSFITTSHQEAGLLKPVRPNLETAGSRTQPRIWDSGPTVSARRSRSLSLNLQTLELLHAIPRTSDSGFRVGTTSVRLRQGSKRRSQPRLSGSFALPKNSPLRSAKEPGNAHPNSGIAKFWTWPRCGWRNIINRPPSRRASGGLIRVRGTVCCLDDLSAWH